MMMCRASHYGRLLVVERNAFLRETAALWLEANDFSVDEAATQSEAITRIASSRYDAVIADVSLDSAEELILPVWLSVKHRATPLIGTVRKQLTPETRRSAEQLGMRQLLVKPYRLPALLEAVESVLNIRAPARHLSLV